MIRVLCLSLVILLGSVAATVAYCMPYKSMVGYLAERYQEYPEVVAVLHDGFLYEVFVSATGGFTVVTTNPVDKLSCMRFVGEGYHRFVQKPLEKPA